MSVNLVYRSLLPVLLLVGCITACKKHHADAGLPPLTSEGKNTFGCKVNDIFFIPRTSDPGSPVSCTYQQLYPALDGYVFVAAGDFTQHNSCTGSSVRIYLDSIALQEGKTYALKSRQTSKHEGAYLSTTDCGTTTQFYYTNDSAVGAVTITHFDPTLGIVAGTFWFDAADTSGKIVHITDGRFDMQYTD